MLGAIAAELRQALGILQKQDIQPIAQRLGPWVSSRGDQTPILLGDDCAAIPDGDGYLLLAAEGLWPTLVAAEPWFAGWCSVLVNVSDVYAMGGRPLAVVDALWSQSEHQAEMIWAGMMAASRAFDVPIVGGHTNTHSPYEGLSVAILGRARSLITSFAAQPGDTLLLLADFNGQPHPTYPFWDAATQKVPAALQAKLEILPTLAEQGLCNAGKDVSMGGLVGTALMLLEASGCGATLALDRIPHPPSLSLTRWLLSFPSYGFLLSVRPQDVAAIQWLCEPHALVCAPIGTVAAGTTLTLQWGTATLPFWDFQDNPLTGFSGHAPSRKPPPTDAGGDQPGLSTPRWEPPRPSTLS